MKTVPKSVAQTEQRQGVLVKMENVPVPLWNKVRVAAKARGMFLGRFVQEVLEKHFKREG